MGQPRATSARRVRLGHRMANHMPDHGKHVAIVGSRQRTDRETVDRLVAALPPGTVVVSGGAPGPDTWAEEAEERYGYKVRIFRPDLDGVRSQGQVTRRYHARN